MADTQQKHRRRWFARRDGGDSRRRQYVLILAIAVGLSLMPLMLLLSSNSTSCELYSNAAASSSNPFSKHNICRIRRQLGTLSHKEGVIKEIEEAQHQQEVQQQQQQQQGQAQGQTQAAQGQTQAAQGQTQEAQGQSQEPAGDKRRADYGVDIDEVEMPRSQEDIERIMKYPHVNECNICRVCVPMSVVIDHPRAQQIIDEGKADPWGSEGGPVVDPSDVHELGRAGGVKLTHYPPPKPKIRPQVRRRRQLLSQPQQTGTQALLQQGLLHEQQQLQQRPSLLQRLWSKLTGSSASAGAADSNQHQQYELSEYEDEDWEDEDMDGLDGRRMDRRGRSLAEDEQSRFEIETDAIFHLQGKKVDLSEIAPGDTKAPARRHMQNCTVCWGCRHTFEMMASGEIMWGNYYSHEPGGSPAWLFRVRTNRTESGWAVVKTWCVPVMKVKQRGFAMCSQKKVYAQIKLLLAQTKIQKECGLDQISPKLWIEPLQGVIPGHGFRIDWLGLWFDVVPGVSIQNLHEFGKPQTNPAVLADMLMNKINGTEMKMAAIFDLLFSQCDRHQQNIFFTEDGKMKIIDNDQVYATAWRRCGIDSMIVPTTQKWMINHLGFFYVLKYPHADPPRTWAKHLNPLMMMDYRCHVENGYIGKSFPPQITQCMTHLAAMTKEEIQFEYGYPDVRMAWAVHNRSRDLLAHGYEWSLLFSEPTNQAQHRYKVGPTCCRMTFNPKDRQFTCNSTWWQLTDIPYGNPWHGGKWHGPDGKDTGSYVGGTEFCAKEQQEPGKPKNSCLASMGLTVPADDVPPDTAKGPGEA